MRTSTFARAGAVLTASALAFTLGTGPASAADSFDDSRSYGPHSYLQDDAVKAPSTSPDYTRRSNAGAMAAGPVVTTYALARNQVLYHKSGSLLLGTVAISNPYAYNYNLTQLSFNGVARNASGLLLSGFATKSPYGGVVVPRTYGPGLYRFLQSRLYSNSTDFTSSTKTSNTIRVRNATKGDNTYRRVGRKHTVKADITVFRPSTGIFGGGVKSARLQYKSGSSWKTYKTIKLNRYGKGSVSFSTSKKRTYRISVSTTLSTQGGNDLYKGKGVYF